MPILYEDEELIVRQALLGPWRVVHKLTGATIAPDSRLKAAMGLAWHAVRTRKGCGRIEKIAAENILMRMFAEAALFPNSPLATKFANTPAEDLADEIYGSN